VTRTPIEATAGYYQASSGIRLFRLLLTASERLWPALAVRAAARLFATPLPPKWLNRRARWDVAWQVERWPFEQASLTVYSQRVAPQAPVVLLVHGWGGHAGQLKLAAEALAEHGLRPVLLEMPAHGRSAGMASNLPQFARAIEYAVGRLRQQGHEVRLLAAHSLGANAAAFAVARGASVQRLALLAPPASPREYTRYFAHVFGLSEATRAAMQRRFEEREAVLMPQFEPHSVAPRIHQPTLVVHDRGDSVNPFRDGQAFAHAIRGAKLIATEGLGHRKMLKDPGVIAQLVAFAR
jgi:pimeloyl-ACP methyl ester carboxylesterase